MCMAFHSGHVMPRAIVVDKSLRSAYIKLPISLLLILLKLEGTIRMLLPCDHSQLVRPFVRLSSTLVTATPPLSIYTTIPSK
jgi:hypothetical protein